MCMLFCAIEILNIIIIIIKNPTWWEADQLATYKRSWGVGELGSLPPERDFEPGASRNEQ